MQSRKKRKEQMSKEMKIGNYKEVSIKDLKPYERNSRTHPTEQIEQIKKSIQEFGFTNPLLINERNEIIAGHGRLEALKQLNKIDFKDNPILKVPCIEVTGLNEAQYKALVIADNKITENAGWNFEILKDELQALELMNYDIDLLGFGDDELIELENDDQRLLQNNNNQYDTQEGEIDPYKKDRGKAGAMYEKYVAPPFSVIDTSNINIINKKRQWDEIIGDNGESREDVLSESFLLKKIQGTSILHSAVSEILVKWFGVKGGYVFDPFAGDSVFGFVSSYLGMKFRGIELRKEQAELNQKRTDSYGLDAIYYNDTSENIDQYLDDESFDLMFSCPPYLDLEVYSDDERDLSNMSHTDFFKMYEKILSKCYKKLKDDTFAILIIGEVRDKNSIYVNFIGRTIEIMIKAGFKYYNEIIMVNNIGSLPFRAGRPFKNSRKIGKHHQNILVFCKGDPLSATKKLNMITSDSDFGVEVSDGDNN